MHCHSHSRRRCLSVQTLLGCALATVLIFLWRSSWTPLKVSKGKERESDVGCASPPPAGVRVPGKSEAFCAGTRAAVAARAARSLSPPALPEEGKYLISSMLYFGRISNIKISLLDMLGAALESRRAFVVPELSECAVDGIDRVFGGLFNDALPLTRRVRSLASFDAVSACNGSMYFVNAGPFQWEGPKDNTGFPSNPSVHNGFDVIPSADDVREGRATDNPLVGTKGFLTNAQQKAGPIHKAYFAPGHLKSFGKYSIDPLFFEKIAARPERCVIFGKNFQSAK